MKLPTTNSKIKNFFIKQFKETPIKIIDSSQGYDQIVKIITTKNNKYILKAPRTEKYIIKNQVFASKKWLNARIPVPRVLFYNRDILVESFTEGIPLDKLKATKKQKQSIYLELGKLMRKMHSVKTKGFGTFTGKGRGKYKTLEDYEKWVKRKISVTEKFIQEHKLLNEKELKSLREYIKKNIKLSLKIKYVLTHQDLCEEHILVKDGKISGIIDLADIKSDDPISDFRRIAKEKYNKQFFPFVIKGYGKVDKKRIDMHRFLLTMYAIPGCFRRRKPHRAEIFIEKLKECIK